VAGRVLADRLSGAVVVPPACRDRVVPLSDPRADPLTRAGIGMIASSELVAGFDWPGPDPRTHLVLVTLGGRGELEVDGERHDLVAGTVAVAPAHRSRRHRARGRWTVITVRIADVDGWQAFHESGAIVRSDRDVRRFEAPVVGMLAEVPAASTIASEVTDPALAPADYLSARFGSRLRWRAGRGAVAPPTDPFVLHATALRMQVESLRLTEHAADPTEAALADLWRAVRDSPAEPWSVEAMARRLHVSRATFHRLVAAPHGASPGAIVRRDHDVRRFEAPVVGMLAELPAASTIASEVTDPALVPADYLAARVGYASPFSFSTAFRRAFGTPPSTFRAEVRQ
jgi:AraC-like DNA-binding protein